MRTQNNPHYIHIMGLIPKDATILDLGCGCGNPFKGIKFPLLVGVDIFRKEFDMPEYDVVIFHDAKKIDKLFQEKSFDVEIIDSADGNFHNLRKLYNIL
ncbi:hypothetical protein LCGC14_2816990, partial [marine sediment metagenome]